MFDARRRMKVMGFIARGIRQFITDSRLKSQGRRRDELMCFSFNATLGVDLFV